MYTNTYKLIQSACSKSHSARFSQKVVSGKKPPTSKNLAAHLEILPLTQKNLVAKIATKTKKFSGKKINPIEVTPISILL